MGMDTVMDSAQAEVAVACAALKTLQGLDFWKIPELDLLALAQSVEGLTRLGYNAQVRLAGRSTPGTPPTDSGPPPPSRCSGKR